MTHIVVVEAGLGSPSSTRLLAERLTAAVADTLGSSDLPFSTDLEFTTVAVRELAHPLVDNLLTGFPSGALVPAVEAVAGADALIVVTPVFAASYSGLFKMFFDVLEPGLLRGKPVLLAATAGTARHSLVLEHALRPLLSYLGALTLPTAVFAAAEDWGAAGVGALDERIVRAATDLGRQLGAQDDRFGTAIPETDEEPAFGAPAAFIDHLMRSARD